MSRFKTDMILPILLAAGLAFPFSNNPIIFLLSVIFMSLLLIYLKKQLRWEFSVAFVLYIFLSLLFSFFPGSIFPGITRIYLILSGFVFAYIYRISDGEKRDLIFLSTAILFVLYALYQKYLVYPQLLEELKGYEGNLLDNQLFISHIRLGRVTGRFLSPNIFAMIPLLFSYPYLSKRKQGYLWFLTIAAVMLLATRSFNLIVFVGVMFFGFDSGFKKIKWYLWLIPLMAVTVLLILRWNDMPFSSGMNPLAERGKNFLAAFRIWLRSPLWGHGIGSFADMYQNFKSSGANDIRYAHNIILQHLCEGGIIYLASFAYVIIHGIKKIKKRERVAVLAIVVHNLLSFSFYSSTILGFMFIFLYKKEE